MGHSSPVGLQFTAMCIRTVRLLRIQAGWLLLHVGPLVQCHGICIRHVVSRSLTNTCLRVNSIEIVFPNDLRETRPIKCRQCQQANICSQTQTLLLIASTRTTATGGTRGKNRQIVDLRESGCGHFGSSKIFFPRTH